LRAGPRAIPAWLVCDRRFLWRYGLGCVQPFTRSTSHFVADGYLERAPTLSGLAQALGIPADALIATVERWNADARRGVDTEFGRGSDINQRHLGDADHRPNPCVAPIEEGPFYAVAVRPADLGMAAGIVTDEWARALAVGGVPIPGLYACGNDMQSVMNGAYPGPGITLGPALVFGYVAARHAAQA
jgi:predicted oxidoreductase